MTEPVSTRETGPEHTPRVPLRSAIDLCGFVDQLTHDAVGELLVDDAGPIRGAVFIENGRVCWAAAHGLACRLTQLLREPAGLDDQEMEELYRRCKHDGVPLGEFLVARGIIDSDDLRRALLQHTAESLGTLCVPSASASWRPRATGGYNPRFTFATSELLARASAHAHASPAIVSTEALAPFSDDIPGEWGAVFVRVRAVAAPLPIAMRGVPPEKSSVVLRVGKWAASALDLAFALGEDARDALVAAEDATSSLVAWQHDEHALVAGRMQAQGPARALNHRAIRRRERRR